ncbi:MAG: DUF4405 domain-containing protein [Magnetococcales bacterium]|nr:DUF4405 domain-containing protein [Magnetococcales bacterium]
MAIQREWVTPVTTGAFLLSAVTGILIFFHVDSGLNKVAHEWLSWVLLGGVLLHVIANFSGFKRHLDTRRGQLLIGVFVLVLLLSFFGSEKKSEPPFAPPIRALSAAPLTTLAQVARLTPGQLRERLVKAGFKPMSDQQSLNELTGPDLRRQVQTITGILDQQR